MICTFYSYKGGVGRSMALANVGEWLYLHGLRVVLVDWDLEAPGLEAFFPSDDGSQALRRQPGLIDLLLDYKEYLPYLTLPPESAPRNDVVAAMQEQLPPLRSVLFALHPAVTTDGGESGLWILPAGRRTADAFTTYARAVQHFDWADFYQRHRGEAYFEWLRRQLLAEDLADVVLIDTRTGISEMGGVATRQLADVIVSFCVPNTQNIEGVMALTESFLRDDVTEARGRAVDLLVVPTRIENSEIDARNAARREFGIAMEHLLPAAMARERRSFWDLRIPYVPKYAYKETLAVGAPDSAEELVAAYEKLALQLLAMAPDGSRARAFADGGVRAARSEPVALPSVSNVPPRVPLVVGRLPQLNEMRSRLSEAGAPLVLFGLGGVGKSTLAIEYAHRFQPDYDVMWSIDARSPERIAAGYVGLAQQLRADGGPSGVATAREWLATHAGWLLIFDGADDPEMAMEHVPREQRGHVLITSLNPQWGRVGTALEVTVLNREDSVELVQRRTGVDPTDAARLAEALGDLPLAIEEACSYMDATGRSIAGYLELFDRQGPRFLARVPRGSVPSDSLAEIWERSYRDLLHYPAGRQLLALCSMLGGEAIPIDVLAQAMPDDGPRHDPAIGFLTDESALDEAIVRLRRYSFATMRGRALWVHPLLQVFVRDWLGTGARETAGRAVTVVRCALGNVGPNSAEVIERLLPHARAAVDHAVELGAAPEDVVELLTVIAAREQARGDCDEAQATFSRALGIAVDKLPPNHPLTERVARSRVRLLVDAGDLHGAQSALEQDLARVKKRGTKAAIVPILGDLGVVLLRLRNMSQAERVTREALDIARGTDHRDDVDRLLVNLAVTHQHTGDFEGAIAIAREVAEIAPADRGHPMDDAVDLARKIIESPRTTQEPGGLLKSETGHGPGPAPADKRR